MDFEGRARIHSHLDITPIVVSLDQTGQLALNGERIELEQLQAVIEPLIKQNADAPITPKSDVGT